MDVTSEADMQRLVGAAWQTFGRLDIMICNAGFGFYEPLKTPAPT